MWIGAGADILLPMGNFGDAFSTGFGGTALFQYDIRPEIGVGVETGYIVYTGKDYNVGGQNIEGPNYSGLPLRAFGKYYFMTNPAALRVYAKAGLGVFFGSTGEQTQTIFGQTYTTPSVSSTDFNFAVGGGVEYPLTANGRTQLDASARYESTDGNGAIGLRLGVNFRIN